MKPPTDNPIINAQRAATWAQFYAAALSGGFEIEEAIEAASRGVEECERLDPVEPHAGVSK